MQINSWSLAQRGYFNSYREILLLKKSLIEMLVYVSKIRVISCVRAVIDSRLLWTISLFFSFSRDDVGCTMTRAKARLRKRRREEIHQSEAGSARMYLPGTGEYRSYRSRLSRSARRYARVRRKYRDSCLLAWPPEAIPASPSSLVPSMLPLHDPLRSRIRTIHGDHKRRLSHDLFPTRHFINRAI